MDVALRLRPLQAIAGLREAGADPEDEIRVVHEIVHGPGHGPSARAERQRVVLGERTLALETGRDGRAEELRQRSELAPGLGVVDTLAGVDDQPFRGDQQLGGAVHGVGVRRRARGHRRDVTGGFGAVLLPDVPRHLDEDRPRPAVAQPGERPAHRRNDRLGQDEVIDPLGDVPVVEVRAEVRWHAHLAPVVTGGDDEDRHRNRRRPARPHRTRSRCPARICIVKTPMLRPDVVRLMASAMWIPVRSWRTMIGRMPAAAAGSMSGLTG